MAVAAAKPIHKRTVAHLKPINSAAAQRKSGRSRVTNGKVLVAGVDQRSGWVRRAKDLIAEFRSDIPDPSAAERSLIRRCAILTVQLEQLEQKFAQARGQAEPAELDLYQKIANTLRRHLSTLGLHRRAKPVLELHGPDGFLARLNNDSEAGA
jgi:hypothetical protein